MAPNFEQLTRQRSLLLWLAGMLLAAFCAALVLVTWTGTQPILQFDQHWPALTGLCGLVALFVLYVQHKHRQLADLETRLRDTAVREAVLQAHFAELTFLFETSTQLQLRLDLPSMLDVAAERLLPCLEAHQSSIMLFDEASGMLEVRAAAGLDAERVANVRVMPGDGLAGHVFATGETLNLTPESAKQRQPWAPDRGRRIAAGLCVPMRFRNVSIGVISVTRASGELFSDLHARMLESFGEHCAATVVKANHHLELLQQVKRAA